ncbi:MAG: response regulator transcription factor [Spirochaetota bacterium]
MYTLIVADDERLIREGMSTLIDWASLGVEVVGTAEDGPATLELLTALDADICIVDIGMPGLSGLEVISAAAERGLETRFIILTGYREFEYVRAALKYSVADYLLKPVDEKELLETTSRIIGSIRESRRVRSSDPRALRAGLYARLCTSGGGDASGSVEAIAELREHGFEQPKYQLVRVFLPRSESSAFDAWLADNDYGVLVDDTNGMTVLLSRFFFRRRDRDAANRIFGEFCSERGLPLDAVCGESAERLERLPAMYAELERLGATRYFAEAPGTAFSGDICSGDESSEPAADFATLTLRITDGVEVGEYDHLRERIAEHLAACCTSEYEAKGKLTRLAVACLDTLGRHHQNVTVSDRGRADLVASIQSSTRLAEAAKLLVAWLRERFPAHVFTGPNVLYRRMCHIAEKDYCENITLKDVARILNYSSAYLGKLFKAEAGVSFGRFVDRLRIERAKELLRDGKRVYVVAEEVGYRHVDYFHAKFRKHMGQSPLEYMRSAASAPEG